MLGKSRSAGVLQVLTDLVYNIIMTASVTVFEMFSMASFCQLCGCKLL